MRIKCTAINKEKTDSVHGVLSVKILGLCFGGNRREVAQVVVFTTIGDRFQVFCISAVGNADTGDLDLFCHIYCLLFFYNGIVGKLIPGDPAALFDEPDDPFGVGISLRDLIQCILDEIMIFHFALPLSSVVYTRSKAGMQ